MTRRNADYAAENPTKPGPTIVDTGLHSVIIALIALVASSVAACGDEGSRTENTLSDSDFTSITSCGTVSENVRLAGDLVTEDNACLDLGASNVIIDGGDRGDGSPWSIEARRRAVENFGHDRVTLRNIDTEDEILIQDAASNVIQGSRTGDILAMGVKDLIVEDSETHALRIVRLRDTILSQRAIVRRNRIVGSQPFHAFRLETGVREVDPDREECLEGNHEIVDNTIIQTGESSVAVFFRCSSNNEFLRNTIEGGVMLVRDDADSNVIRDNRIRVAREDTRAFSIASGNANKTHPRGNRIEDNVFVARTKPAFRLQAAGARDNVFRRNVFIWGGDESIEIKSPLGNEFDHNTFRRRSIGPLLAINDLNRADVDTPNTYTNNVFEYEEGVVFEVVGDSRDLSGFSGNYNVYYNRSSDPKATVEFGTSMGRLSFEEWVEESGEGEESIVGDPEFCDPQNDDLSLRAASAARDAGEDGSDAGALRFDPSRSCPSADDSSG